MNKTNLILYSFGLLLCVAVCSCQDDPATVEEDDGGGGSEVMFALSTRAGGDEVETTFAEGTAIGIVRQGIGAVNVNANNYLYTYADGIFHAAPDRDKILWDKNVTNIAVEAFYPYNNSGYETLSVNADQSNTDAGGQSNYFLSDALHAKGSVATRKDSIELTFHHVMSKLVLNITKFNTDEAIRTVTLGDNDLPLSASFTYKDNGSVDGVSSRGTANASITTCPDAAKLDADAFNSSKWRAIIIPQENAKIKVTVETNIGSYSTTLPQCTYVSGGQYTCSLKVLNAALVVTGSTIQPWGEAESGTGNAEI